MLALAVVVFLSSECMVTSAYFDRLGAIYREFQPAGVSFTFVNSNVNESDEQIASQAKANELPFTIQRDPTHKMADRLGARVTPEAFVLDGAGKILYRGAIDDAKNAARVKIPALRNAIQAALAGQRPAINELKAPGCTIKRRVQQP